VDHSEEFKGQKSIKYAHGEVYKCNRNCDSAHDGFGGVRTNEIAKNDQVWRKCGHLFVYVICVIERASTLFM
jgi:hypothetical protein